MLPVDVVVLQQTTPSVEHADSPVSTVINFVATKHWARLGLNPDSGHGIFENLKQGSWRL
jgi:hypothetical protein